MAADIVYLGQAEFHRTPVLEHAGYEVCECESIRDFESALYQPPPPGPDAVVVDGVESAIFWAALKLVYACPSPTPVIHFPETYLYDYQPRYIDLIVPPLTRPEEWLREIADLLERSRVIRNKYEDLRLENEQLRREFISVKETTALELERIARMRQEHKILEDAAWPHIKHPPK